jgi:three-Cys-motif partner protein
VILVESSPKLRVALEQRVARFGDRVKVLSGDCNAKKTIAAIRSRIPANSLTLVFADMLGLEVEFETLRQLTENRKVDVAITFQVSDLVRNVPLILQGASGGDRLDRFFGTRVWRQVVADAEGGKLKRPDIGDALTEFTFRGWGRSGTCTSNPCID